MRERGGGLTLTLSKAPHEVFTKGGHFGIHFFQDGAPPRLSLHAIFQCFLLAGFPMVGTFGGRERKEEWKG
jgi:hypothetical protein